jgi:hypothetical protein
LYFSQIERPFSLRCDAGASGSFSASASKVFVTVSQPIVRDGKQEMWDCVVVHSAREPDGSLRTRVLICNPEWDEPLEVANIESRPEQGRGASRPKDLLGHTNERL